MGHRRLATVLLCAESAVSLGAPASNLFQTEASLVNRTVPDVELHLEDGRLTRLSALWSDRALLLTLFYRRCTGTCEPLLLSVRDAVGRTGGLGTEYRILGLSFDASDTAEDMRAQARALDLANAHDWKFAVASASDVQRISDALGFWFRRDPATGQFDHPTLLVAIRNGRIVRALAGYPLSRERLLELVWELRGRFVPYYEIPGQSTLRCFEYDPRTGALRPDWGMLLLLVPGISAVTAGVGVFMPRRRSGTSSTAVDDTDQAMPPAR